MHVGDLITDRILDESRPRLGRGKRVKPSDYRTLYHLCDYIGFSYAVENDAIRSRGHGYVSTTWDPDMDNVVGRPFAVFKFVLDGEAIARDRVAFHYQDHGHYTDGSGIALHVEHEIGIDGPELPLSPYHLGTILRFDLFSEQGVQWLLYRNKRSRGSALWSEENDATPQAIETIYRHIFELRKPLWKREAGVHLTADELRFLREAYRIRKSGGFNAQLEHLADRFPMVDLWNERVDGDTYRRRHKSPEMVKLLNDYFSNRRVDQVDVGEVRKIIERCIDILGLGTNTSYSMKAALVRSGLYHPATPAVTWGSILTKAMDGDPEKVEDIIEFYVDHDRRLREIYDSALDTFSRSWIHVGTDFGRGGNR